MKRRRFVLSGLAAAVVVGLAVWHSGLAAAEPTPGPGGRIDKFRAAGPAGVPDSYIVRLT
jgi:hypothetical protein